MRSQSARWPLVLLAVCVFFVICTEVLPIGLLPEIGLGLRVSTAETGVLVSLYAVVVAVMSVPIAAVVERWPRRPVLAALLVGYAASNVAFAISPGYGVAIVARVVAFGSSDHHRHDRQCALPRLRHSARDGTG